MPWFVAHSITYIKMQRHKQTHFPVWENMYLVRANSGKEAFCKAEKLARSIEAATKNVTLNGKPAFELFGGIRKVVQATGTLLEGRLRDGIELSFSQYEVRSEKDVAKLAKGKSVKVRYTE